MSQTNPNQKQNTNTQQTQSHQPSHPTKQAEHAEQPQQQPQHAQQQQGDDGAFNFDYFGNVVDKHPQQQNQTQQQNNKQQQPQHPQNQQQQQETKKQGSEQPKIQQLKQQGQVQGQPHRSGYQSGDENPNQGSYPQQHRQNQNQANNVHYDQNRKEIYEVVDQYNWENNDPQQQKGEQLINEHGQKIYEQDYYQKQIQVRNREISLSKSNSNPQVLGEQSSGNKSDYSRDAPKQTKQKTRKLSNSGVQVALVNQQEEKQKQRLEKQYEELKNKNMLLEAQLLKQKQQEEKKEKQRLKQKQELERIKKQTQKQNQLLLQKEKQRQNQLQKQKKIQKEREKQIEKQKQKQIEKQKQKAKLKEKQLQKEIKRTEKLEDELQKQKQIQLQREKQIEKEKQKQIQKQKQKAKLKQKELQKQLRKTEKLEDELQKQKRRTSQIQKQNQEQKILLAEKQQKLKEQQKQLNKIKKQKKKKIKQQHVNEGNNNNTSNNASNQKQKVSSQKLQKSQNPPQPSSNPPPSSNNSTSSQIQLPVVVAVPPPVQPQPQPQQLSQQIHQTMIIKQAQKQRIYSTLKMFMQYIDKHKLHTNNQKSVLINVYQQIDRRKSQKYVWYHLIKQYLTQYQSLAKNFHEQSYKLNKQQKVFNKNAYLNIGQQLKQGIDQLAFLKRQSGNDYNRMNDYIGKKISLELQVAFNKFISQMNRAQNQTNQKKKIFVQLQQNFRKNVQRMIKIYNRGRQGKPQNQDVFVQTCKFIQIQKQFRYSLILWGKGIVDLRKILITLQIKLNQQIQLVLNQFKTIQANVYSFHQQKFQSIINSKQQILRQDKFSKLCTLSDSDYIKYTYEFIQKIPISQVSDKNFQYFIQMPHFQSITGKSSDLLKGMINKSFILKNSNEQLINTISGNLVQFNRQTSQYKDKFIVKNLSATIVADGVIQFDQILPGIIFNDHRTIRVGFRDQDRAQELICLLNQKV